VSKHNLYFFIQVYDDLNPLGICMSYDTTWNDTEKLAKENRQQLVAAVKKEQSFRLVGDNINFSVGVKYVRDGNSVSTKDWFGSAAIIKPPPVPLNATSSAPQGRVADLAIQQLLPSDAEKDLLKDCFIAQVCEVIKDHVAPMKYLAAYGPERPNSEFLSKDTVHFLHVLPFNEQKYQDMIQIMQEYERVIADVYHEAGVPLDDKKVHVGGDQLTRERMSGAKGLMVVEKTQAGRFEHLSPITFEIFHLQMNVLTMFFKVLYKEKCTQPGTLAAEKVRLSRDNVHIDVKNHYEACKDLAISFVNSYIVEALCEFFGMDNAGSVPKKIKLPAKNGSAQQKQEWVKLHIGNFVDTMITNKPLPEPVNATTVHMVPVLLSDGTIQLLQLQVPTLSTPTEPDLILNYAHNVLELGVLFKELLRATHYPCRKLFLAILKELMILLKGHNFQNKYSLEILRFLFHQYAALYESMALNSFFALFVNTSGKEGKCIPADLVMEHNVRKCKDVLKTMGPNKTVHAIGVRTGAIPGLELVSNNYRSVSGCIVQSAISI
jgi:hypothetical protein